MVGALVAVGEGKMGLEDISKRLEVGSTRAPGGFRELEEYSWLGCSHLVPLELCFLAPIPSLAHPAAAA